MPAHTHIYVVKLQVVLAGLRISNDQDNDLENKQWACKRFPAASEQTQAGSSARNLKVEWVLLVQALFCAYSCE